MCLKYRSKNNTLKLNNITLKLSHIVFIPLLLNLIFFV